MTGKHAHENMQESTTAALTEEVRNLLDAHWRPEHGCSVPNPGTYPHLWLWDSCFHAIIWAKLEDARAVQELEAVLAGQLDNGLVPHMQYGGEGPDTWLGPLARTSSLTQPPMFGHAIKLLADAGITLAPETLARARRPARPLMKASLPRSGRLRWQQPPYTVSWPAPRPRPSFPPITGPQ